MFTTVVLHEFGHTHADVLRGLASHGASLPAQRAMQGTLYTTSPSQALDGALARLRQGECRVLMVVADDKVVGLLTAGNVEELLALEAAGRRRDVAGAGARAR